MCTIHCGSDMTRRGASPPDGADPPSQQKESHTKCSAQPAVPRPAHTIGSASIAASRYRRRTHRRPVRVHPQRRTPLPYLQDPLHHRRWCRAGARHQCRRRKCNLNPLHLRPTAHLHLLPMALLRSTGPHRPTALHPPTALLHHRPTGPRRPTAPIPLQLLHGRTWLQWQAFSSHPSDRPWLAGGNASAPWCSIFSSSGFHSPS